MERDAVGVGDAGHLSREVERQRLAHRMSVCVLYGNQAGDRFVWIGRVPEGFGESVRTVEVEGSVGVLAHLPDR